MTPEEELREALLDQLHTAAEFWARPDIDGDMKYRLHGLIHSVLSTLDGCSMGVPVAFDLHASVAPEDVEDGAENAKYKDVVISEMLHELYYKNGRG